MSIIYFSVIGILTAMPTNRSFERRRTICSSAGFSDPKSCPRFVRHLNQERSAASNLLSLQGERHNPSIYCSAAEAAHTVGFPDSPPPVGSNLREIRLPGTDSQIREEVPRKRQYSGVRTGKSVCSLGLGAWSDPKSDRAEGRDGLPPAFSPFDCRVIGGACPNCALRQAQPGRYCRRDFR
jgi:hypothetical protein